jgi:hypothetical protein
MHGPDQVGSRRQAQFLPISERFGFVRLGQQHIDHHVANLVDLSGRDAFFPEIRVAILRRSEQQIG